MMCLKEFEELKYTCSCGMKFCSEQCLNEHKISHHKKIAGLPVIYTVLIKRKLINMLNI
jgi:hypothetical protein